MNFIDIAELTDKHLAVMFLVCGYEAVDRENRLALYTTNGRVKNKRKWFVVRYSLPSGKVDNSCGHMQFRAVDLPAALEWLKQERNQKRILEVVK